MVHAAANSGNGPRPCFAALWELGCFSDKGTSQAIYHELQEKGYIRYDHLPLQSKGGKKVEVEFVSNVYHVDHRSVAQCNIRDISERIRLERKTQEQSEALADLHRRKDEFLAMLGHELRNPLAAISNGAQLLRLQQNEGPTQQKARGIIERQVVQLTRLIDDLLEVARITTGRIHLQQEQVILNDVVKNGIETSYALISERKHVLTVSIPSQPIWVCADSSRLEQVVVNLLTNAAKYTHDGGQIWVTLEHDEADCVLRIRDSGIGIAPNLLSQIFDLFTQAERSLDRAQGGLGIGLALVRRLVELHGGTVTVSSNLGCGSEFVVGLPMLRSARRPLPSFSPETVAPPSPKLRVMVVDDNVDMAEGLALLLRESGHEVQLAYDGSTALEAALKVLPNVMLLDIRLPQIDGYEVAKRLRALPLFQNTVLVAMTGYGQKADHERSLKAGFDHYCVKPVDFGHVQQILATISTTDTWSVSTAGR